MNANLWVNGCSTGFRHFYFALSLSTEETAPLLVILNISTRIYIVIRVGIGILFGEDYWNMCATSPFYAMTCF